MFTKVKRLAACEKEVRIRVALWAYAYEVKSDSLVSDAVFDDWARAVNVDNSTNRPDLDKWFKENYDAHTGSWVHKHPEKHKLEAIYNNIRNKK